MYAAYNLNAKQRRSFEHLTSLLNNSGLLHLHQQSVVFLLKVHDVVLQALDLLGSLAEVFRKLLVADDASCLAHLLVFELGLLENLGLRCESRLVVLELAFELVTLHLLLLVLLLDELVLLTVVAQDDDIRDNLRAQLRELIVSLFHPPAAPSSVGPSPGSEACSSKRCFEADIGGPLGPSQRRYPPTP